MREGESGERGRETLVAGSSLHQTPTMMMTVRGVRCLTRESGATLTAQEEEEEEVEEEGRLRGLSREP